MLSIGSSRIVKTVAACALVATLSVAATACTSADGTSDPAADQTTQETTTEETTEDTTEGDSAEPEQASVDALTETYSHNGITISVDPSWSTELKTYNAEINPSRNTRISLRCFVEDASVDLASIEESGVSLIGGAASYTAGESWTIDGDTTVTLYTYEEGPSVYDVAVGYNAETGNGFQVFFSRSDGREGYLTDEVRDAIIDSISFDPSQAVAYAAK